ncbi:MAG: hypothetical protein ACR2P3_06675 [Geminicoccaceae bacterium]
MPGHNRRDPPGAGLGLGLRLGLRKPQASEPVIGTQDGILLLEAGAGNLLLEAGAGNLLLESS